MIYRVATNTTTSARTDTIKVVNADGFTATAQAFANIAFIK